MDTCRPSQPPIFTTPTVQISAMATSATQTITAMAMSWPFDAGRGDLSLIGRGAFTGPDAPSGVADVTGITCVSSPVHLWGGWTGSWRWMRKPSSLLLNVVSYLTWWDHSVPVARYDARHAEAPHADVHTLKQSVALLGATALVRLGIISHDCLTEPGVRD